MTADILRDLETALSPERFATYMQHVAGNRQAAERLYIWNTAASAAFYGPLQSLEVALRNALHKQLTLTYGHAWYDDPRTGLDDGARNRVMKARSDLIRSGYSDDPPHMVAALSFGFWVSLLGKGGRISLGQGKKADYEAKLWRPALRSAFPNVQKLNRRQAHEPLDYLRTLRNRIAHHEPIFNRHLTKDYAQILNVLGWISLAKRDWVASYSRLPHVLQAAPSDPNLRF